VFDAPEVLHLAVISGLLRSASTCSDGSPARRGALVPGRTAAFVAALLVWMAMSVPFALSTGASFDLVFNNFIRPPSCRSSCGSGAPPAATWSASRRVLLQRRIYSLVVITRFDLGGGGKWRLGHLYYYDANDSPRSSSRRFRSRPFPARRDESADARGRGAGLVVLTLGFVCRDRRGGFIALGAVACSIVFRKPRSMRWRVSATALSPSSSSRPRAISTAADGTITSRRLQPHVRVGPAAGSGAAASIHDGKPAPGCRPRQLPVGRSTLSPLAERQQYGSASAGTRRTTASSDWGGDGLPGASSPPSPDAFAALRLRARRSGARPRRTSHAPLTPALTGSLIGFVSARLLSLAYSGCSIRSSRLAVGLHKVTSDAVHT